MLKNEGGSCDSYSLGVKFMSEIFCNVHFMKKRIIVYMGNYPNAFLNLQSQRNVF